MSIQQQIRDCLAIQAQAEKLAKRRAMRTSFADYVTPSQLDCLLSFSLNDSANVVRNFFQLELN